jgi:hypothetical protein
MTWWDAATIAAIFVLAGGLTVIARGYWKLRARLERHLRRHEKDVADIAEERIRLRA